MLKELIEILSECEYLKDITPCASDTELDTVALMPYDGRIVRKYTDGKTLNSSSFKLLYKTYYSPYGDKIYTTDDFFDAVKKWIDNRFKDTVVTVNDIEFISALCDNQYKLYRKTPSAAIYSLKFQIDYFIL